MSIRKPDKMIHEILEALEKDLVEDQIAAKLITKEGAAVETLAVVLNNAVVEGKDALGEFFFLPVAEEGDLNFFVNLITISEDINEANIAELAAAVSAINTFITLGAFAVDYAAKSIVYRHTYEMPIDAERKKIEDGIDLSMDMALHVLKDYGHLVLDVNDGKINSKELISHLYGG
jgi:hypothetical protein